MHAIARVRRSAGSQCCRCQANDIDGDMTNGTGSSCVMGKLYTVQWHITVLAADTAPHQSSIAIWHSETHFTATTALHQC